MSSCTRTTSLNIVYNLKHYGFHIFKHKDILKRITSVQLRAVAEQRIDSAQKTALMVMLENMSNHHVFPIRHYNLKIRLTGAPCLINHLSFIIRNIICSYTLSNTRLAIIVFQSL